MYKLTIISGPNRGSSFALRDGENTIGRQSGNSVILSSSRVSKRHCVLVVSHGKIVVQDQNSANGTFINGVLSKEKDIRAGDRISVGDFVLEVSQPSKKSLRSAPAVPDLGHNVLQFPVPRTGKDVPGEALDFDQINTLEAPKDLKGKVLWALENHVMPFFYNLNFKYEWKYVTGAIFSVFVIICLLISIQPLLESTEATVIMESGRRADFIAKEIVSRNAPYLAQGNEVKTEISPEMENGDGVRLAVLIDMRSRIIAPASKLNSSLVNGAEGRYAAKARDLFEAGRETGLIYRGDPTAVVAIEPLRVASTAQGKNVTIGMAVVSIDSTLFSPTFGQIGLIYSQTFILVAILGLLILFVLYRLTLRPFLVLSEELDKGLKGDLSEVSRESKFTELSSLWDLINSALQRIPKDGMESHGLRPTSQEPPSPEEYLGPMKQLGGLVNFGLLICDHEKKIVHMNEIFEELTGIHLDQALGQEMAGVARDQSLGSFMTDLLDRAASTPEGVTDDYEFSGNPYQVHASTFGTSANVKGYMISVMKGEG